MSEEDIRWQQRLANFQKALAQLQKFVDKGELSDLEKQGLIKAFEYSFELGWTTIKDFLEYRGQSEIYGSRDAIRKAFELGLIKNGQGWMDMLASRNKTSHTYNQEIADEICAAVLGVYHSLLQQLDATLDDIKSD